MREKEEEVLWEELELCAGEGEVWEKEREVCEKKRKKFYWKS